ncbi:MAG: hypothetical protein SPI77_00925 [Corynebacterium sp.]|nr:hypothetical protein [Corynebacterium sp.]
MNTRTFATIIATTAVIMGGTAVAGAQEVVDAPAPIAIEATPIALDNATDYVVDQIAEEAPINEEIVVPGDGHFADAEITGDQIADEAEDITEGTDVNGSGEFSNAPSVANQIANEAAVPAAAEDNGAIIGGVLGGLAALIALIGGAAAIFPQLQALLGL